MSFEYCRKILFFQFVLITFYNDTSHVRRSSLTLFKHYICRKKLISVKDLKNFYRLHIRECDETRETISGSAIAASDIMNCSDVTCITSARLTTTSSVEARRNPLANCHRKSNFYFFSISKNFFRFLYSTGFYSLKLNW